jgi:hypothetical protein
VDGAALSDLRAATHALPLYAALLPAVGHAQLGYDVRFLVVVAILLLYPPPSTFFIHPCSSSGAHPCCGPSSLVLTTIRTHHIQPSLTVRTLPTHHTHTAHPAFTPHIHSHRTHSITTAPYCSDGGVLTLAEQFTLFLLAAPRGLFAPFGIDILRSVLCEREQFTACPAAVACRLCYFAL